MYLITFLYLKSEALKQRYNVTGLCFMKYLFLFIYLAALGPS